ncbi:MAG: phospholipid carrier-dependent glycosyltransferase [Oscillospiraceae bacterium]|nr:phospholipid carrier-dependent glycosyltransferase [Oscillospiraceae bacterium]
MKLGYIAVVFPVVTVACLVLFFRYYIEASRLSGGSMEWIDRALRRRRFEFRPRFHPMSFRRDAVPLAAITAVFAAAAFIGLGDTRAPQSYYKFTSENSGVFIELGRETQIGNIMFFTGLWTGHYTLELSRDGVNWQEQYPADDHEHTMDQPHSHLFKWRYADINEENLPTSYIRIIAQNTPLELGEIAVYDASGELVPRGRISAGGPADALFDEQDLAPEYPSYMNGMYFDEIYHARAAFENLRRVYPNENSHPPLGKAIISLGVTLFGMTPFGWRFMGALFGVLMLPAFYVLLKNMFGKTPVAVCGTLLFGFDFMRFVQTRIATIDTYGVFFILLAYLFMYRYISYDGGSLREAARPLMFSGVSFGLGCASKWIVVYAGAGLAVLFILKLITARRDCARGGSPKFAPYLAKTLLIAFLAFAAIPAAIYIASYIPNGVARGMAPREGMFSDPDYYAMILENQKFMFSYHSKLVAEHSYSSMWLQWITDARPILYFRAYPDGDTAVKSAFAAFGNPVVWWGGFMAMAAAAVQFVKRRDGAALFIVIGYLSQLVPWLLVSRIVFIYHYFPSTLFLILALAHVMNALIERGYGRYKAAIYGYTASSGALFAMFYPALTGVPAPQRYFTYFLRWIPGAWPF